MKYTIFEEYTDKASLDLCIFRKDIFLSFIIEISIKLPIRVDIPWPLNLRWATTLNSIYIRTECLIWSRMEKRLRGFGVQLTISLIYLSSSILTFNSHDA